jgi:hypothetical protein
MGGLRTVSRIKLYADLRRVQHSIQDHASPDCYGIRHGY